jgi:hypothetical protein
VKIAITGGYHSEGLKELFNQKGITFITVTPTVTGNIEDAQKNYKQIINTQADLQNEALAYVLTSNSPEPYQIAQIFAAAINAGVNITALINEMGLTGKVEIDGTTIKVDGINFTATKISADEKAKAINLLKTINPSGFSFNGAATDMLRTAGMALGMLGVIEEVERAGLDNAPEIAGANMSDFARFPEFIQKILLSKELKSNYSMTSYGVSKETKPYSKHITRMLKIAAFINKTLLNFLPARIIETKIAPVTENSIFYAAFKEFQKGNTAAWQAIMRYFFEAGHKGYRLGSAEEKQVYETDFTNILKTASLAAANAAGAKLIKKVLRNAHRSHNLNKERKMTIYSASKIHKIQDEKYKIFMEAVKRYVDDPPEYFPKSTLTAGIYGTDYTLIDFLKAVNEETSKRRLAKETKTAPELKLITEDLTKNQQNLNKVLEMLYPVLPQHLRNEKSILDIMQNSKGESFIAAQENEVITAAAWIKEDKTGGVEIKYIALPDNEKADQFIKLIKEHFKQQGKFTYLDINERLDFYKQNGYTDFALIDLNTIMIDIPALAATFAVPETAAEILVRFVGGNHTINNFIPAVAASIQKFKKTSPEAALTSGETLNKPFSRFLTKYFGKTGLKIVQAAVAPFTERQIIKDIFYGISDKLSFLESHSDYFGNETEYAQGLNYILTAARKADATFSIKFLKNIALNIALIISHAAWNINNRSRALTSDIDNEDLQKELITSWVKDALDNKNIVYSYLVFLTHFSLGFNSSYFNKSEAAIVEYADNFYDASLHERTARAAPNTIFIVNDIIEGKYIGRVNDAPLRLSTLNGVQIFSAYGISHDEILKAVSKNYFMQKYSAYITADETQTGISFEGNIIKAQKTLIEAHRANGTLKNYAAKLLNIQQQWRLMQADKNILNIAGNAEADEIIKSLRQQTTYKHSQIMISPTQMEILSAKKIKELRALGVEIFLDAQSPSIKNISVYKQNGLNGFVTDGKLYHLYTGVISNAKTLTETDLKNIDEVITSTEGHNIISLDLMKKAIDSEFTRSILHKNNIHQAELGWMHETFNLKIISFRNAAFAPAMDSENLNTQIHASNLILTRAMLSAA